MKCDSQSELESEFRRMQVGRCGVRDPEGTRVTGARVRQHLVICLLIGLVILSGCTTTPDRGETPTSTPTPAGGDSLIVGTPSLSDLPTEAIGGTPAMVAAELGAVIWTGAVNPTAGAPATPVAAFPPDSPALYAVLPIIRIDPGATLTATWTYNDTPLDALTNSVRASEARKGGWIEFHLDRTGAEPWPDGTYGIAVSADGHVVQTGEVRVENA